MKFSIVPRGESGQAPYFEFARTILEHPFIGFLGCVECQVDTLKGRICLIFIDYPKVI